MKKLFIFFLVLTWAGLVWAVPPSPPPSDEAYDATEWDGNANSATKNALRDKIEAMGGSGSASLVLVPLATTAIAIDIQGETNDYTGAGASVTFNLNRDVNRGSGLAIPNYAGWQSYLNLKHTDAWLADNKEGYGAISRINHLGRLTNVGAGNYQYFTVGAHNTVKMSASSVFDTDSTGSLTLDFTGTYGYVFGDSGWSIEDTGGNTPANTVTAAGVRAFVENDLTLTSGAATVTSAGLYVDQVIGSTDGTSLGAGIYIANGVTGSDTNYAIYSLETDPSLLSGAFTNYGVLTITPDGTNEVFQVNDGTIDFTNGAAGVSGVLTINAGGDWSYNKDIVTSNGKIAGTTYASDGTITDADLLAIDDGATTKLAVGGGVGSPMNWLTPTEATSPLIPFLSTTQTVTVSSGSDLTPTAAYKHIDVELTTDTADPALIGFVETGAINNAIAVVQNVAANTASFAWEAGVFEHNGGTGTSIVLEQYQSMTVQYMTDRWVCIATTGSQFFSSFTTVEIDAIPVGYMIDGASAPDALETITSGTDKANVRTFSTSADEDLVFTWEVPGDIDATTGIKFRVICFVYHATGPSAETWQFELQGFSLGDGDALDGTLGTAQTSNSGSRTDAQYDRVATAWSSAMTSTHITNLTAGETVEFKLYRDVDDTDDYGQVVAISTIQLKYKRSHDTTF